MKGKPISWNNMKVTLDGVELKGVTSVNYEPSYSLEQWKNKLREAEQNEEYELCAKIKIKIDNYKE